jgi:catechol 2,3-dioxygenase-like lactoylglutathione lyase family enzyme
MSNAWPELAPYAEWGETCRTLQLCCQVIGKVRLALSPWLNHSWHATLYPTARGLTTSLVPHGERMFEIELDLVAGAVVVRPADAEERRIELVARPVADFYAAVMAALDAAGLSVKIHAVPSEVPDPVPFRDDRRPRVLDMDQVRRFWRALLQVERVFASFRTGYLGKVSPIHLFWGGFDLAMTRFSGRPAPLHPGGIPGLPDEVTREAYSHEVSSTGFWPGGPQLEAAAFYSYAYPTPDGFGSATVGPAGATFDAQLQEFILPYEVVRAAPSPDAALLEFLETTYRAAADLGRWDRAALECAIGAPGVVRHVGPAERGRT